MKRMFDFSCENCKNVFERYVDDSVATTECKHCGEPGATRVVSPPRGFEFKGTGFYSTDY